MRCWNKNWNKTISPVAAWKAETSKILLQFYFSFAACFKLATSQFVIYMLNKFSVDWLVVVHFLFCCSWLQLIVIRLIVSCRIKMQTTLLALKHWGKELVALATVAHLHFSMQFLLIHCNLVITLILGAKRNERYNETSVIMKWPFLTIRHDCAWTIKEWRKREMERETAWGGLMVSSSRMGLLDSFCLHWAECASNNWATFAF